MSQIVHMLLDREAAVRGSVPACGTPSFSVPFSLVPVLTTVKKAGVGKF